VGSTYQREREKKTIRERGVLGRGVDSTWAGLVAPGAAQLGWFFLFFVLIRFHFLFFSFIYIFCI
jgi:hypothetical protein